MKRAHINVEAMEVGLLRGTLHNHVVGEPGPGVGREQLLHVHSLGRQVGLAQVVDVERHLVLDLRAPSNP